jgi:ABC-type nitrate/sulfonate/bicarbonate transport system permease component
MLIGFSLAFAVGMAVGIGIGTVNPKKRGMQSLLM